MRSLNELRHHHVSYTEYKHMINLSKDETSFTDINCALYLLTVNVIGFLGLRGHAVLALSCDTFSSKH